MKLLEIYHCGLEFKLDEESKNEIKNIIFELPILLEVQDKPVLEVSEVKGKSYWYENDNIINIKPVEGEITGISLSRFNSDYEKWSHPDKVTISDHQHKKDIHIYFK